MEKSGASPPAERTTHRDPHRREVVRAPRAQRHLAGTRRGLHPGDPRRAGNLFFEWSRSVDDPNEFVLEAFADGAAGAAHVQSEHFRTALEWMPDYVSSTPRIVNVEIPDAQGWSEMAEVQPR